MKFLRFIHIVCAFTLPMFTYACSNTSNKAILAHVRYTSQDSTLIVKLLTDARKLPASTNRMAYFGMKFVGIPYVAHTLEADGDEQLIVNLRELDCTTFVETCAALTIADKRKQCSFDGFCHALLQLRYRYGKCKGYTSRLHYFSQWIVDNESLNLVKESTHEGEPFTAKQKLSINYMSTHPNLYARLKTHPNEVILIRKQENELNGHVVSYIPKSKLNGTSAQLKDIKTGDILAIITAKSGLDTSHLGIAVWKNGHLHLLNASMIYKKVVLDTNTLYSYSAKRKSNLGIRVVRVL